MTKQSAYSLVEVLVAVSIFSTVAIGAVSVVASSAQGDQQRKSAALVSGDIGQAVRYLEQDISYVNRSDPASYVNSLPTPGLVVAKAFPLGDTPTILDMDTPDTALYLSRSTTFPNGSARTALYDAPNQTRSQAVYCPVLQKDAGGAYTGKRLARLTLPADTAFPATVPPGRAKCEPGDLAVVFGVPVDQITVQYLTGETVETTRFQLWPVWPSSWPAPADYSVNPPVIRAEIAARSRATVAGVDDRATRLNGSLPTVVRRDISFRSSKFTNEAP